MPELRKLRQMDCGCTSGHDSLIRIWVPEEISSKDVDHLESMWGLLLGILRRAAIPKFTGFDGIPEPEDRP